MNIVNFFRVFLLFLTILFSEYANADDISDARDAGKNFLAKLEDGKNKEVWDDNISDLFKERMTKDAFLANATMIRAQLGNTSTNRKLIQQNKADGLPGYDLKGPVYSFMFSTQFPGAKVYEMVTIIYEKNNYKIVGFNFLPNPN